MNCYLLSLHVEAGTSCTPPTPEAMQAMMQKVGALDDELRSGGAWVASGKLTDADSATVVRVQEGDLLTTDGPFVEAKEHIAGFYIIRAEDLDGALRWASKISEALSRPIEVRPFAGFQGE